MCVCVCVCVWKISRRSFLIRSLEDGITFADLSRHGNAEKSSRDEIQSSKEEPSDVYSEHLGKLIRRNLEFNLAYFGYSSG